MLLTTTLFYFLVLNSTKYDKLQKLQWQQVYFFVVNKEKQCETFRNSSQLWDMFTQGPKDHLLETWMV